MPPNCAVYIQYGEPLFRKIAFKKIIAVERRPYSTECRFHKPFSKKTNTKGCACYSLGSLVRLLTLKSN